MGSDLSTDSPLLVDLSPGREADLWITSVDNDNQLIGLAWIQRLGTAGTGGRGRSDRLLQDLQNRPSWHRVTQSAADMNSSSDVPGRGGCTSPGFMSARG